MKRKSWMAIVAVFLLIFIFPASAAAAPVGKITALEGSVDITTAGKIKPLQINDLVNIGDILRSKANSKARVTFNDGNELWIAEKTRLKITQYQNEPGQKSFFNLFRGKARSVVANLAKEAIFEVHTPTAICGVRGTIFIGFFQNGQSGFVFEQGQGYGYNPKIPTQVVTISAGQSMTISAPEKPPVVRPVTTGEIQKHVQDTSANPPKEDEGDKPPTSGDQGSGGTSNQGQQSGSTEESSSGNQQSGNAEGTVSGGQQSGTSEGPSAEGSTPQGQGGTPPTPEPTVTVTPPVTPTPMPTSTPPSTPQPPTIPIVIPQDVSAPVLTVTSTPPSLTNASAATFSYQANETSNFEYRLDGSGWQSAGSATTASSMTIPSVSEGTHTFELRAIDTAGNVSPSATYSWATDYTAPSFDVSGIPTGTTQHNSADINITGESGAAYAYSLDGESWIATGTSIELANLADGAHNIQIRATDTLDNVSAPTTYSWSIDHTAPTFSVSGIPSGVTNQSSASISMTGEAGATYAYSFDDGSWISTGTNIALAGLAEGTHNIQIKATDEAGNVSGISSFNWSIDSLPPTFSVSGVPSGVTNQSSAGISMTGEAGATYAYSFDNGSWITTGASITLTALSEGTHSIQIKATDAAGNVSGISSFNWSIDSLPPTFSVSGIPSGVTSQSSAGISMTGETGATYAYSLDNGNWINSSSTINLTGLTEGAHSIQIKATDSAGNVSASTTYSWSTDYTAPSFSASGIPSGTTKLNNASITLSGETGATFAYSLNGGSWITTGTNIVLTALAEGAHSIQIRATDSAGNASTSTAYSWTTDYTAPSFSASGVPSGTTTQATASITLTGDAGTTYTYTLDGGSSTATDGTITLAGLSNGSHTITVQGTDSAGNTTTVTYNWTVNTITDTTPPVITIASKSASTTAAGSTSVVVSLTADEAATFVSRLDGGSPVNGATPDFTNVASGTHTLEVTSTDDAGNTSTENLTFTLENHTVSGTFAGIGGVSCSATGNVAGVLDNNWGGWTIAMTATGGDPAENWNISTGGKNPDNSYWLSVGPGTTNSTAKTLTGTSNLIYLSPTRLGLGSGTVAGTYTDAGIYSLTNTNSGGYTEKPLKFMSQFSGNLVSGLTYPSVMTVGNTPVMITLTWGVTPFDLDSHLWVPPNSSSNHIEVYYGNMGTTHNSPFAELNTNVTDGGAPNKPEIITISKLRNGRYYYSVENYSESPAITTSGATVLVSDKSGNTCTFNVPVTGDGLWYNVFYLENDAIYSINSIGNSSTYAAGLSTGSDSIVGTYSAILGSDTSLWGAGSPVSFYILGTVTNLGSTQNFVFRNAINSSNVTLSNNTTYDGGAYAGWMSGILGDSVDGVIYAFYREPHVSGSGNMGIMKGAFSGSTYPGIGMWKADGNFSQMLTLGTTAQLPENLVSEVTTVNIPYGGSGNIMNAAGTAVKTVSISSTNLNIHKVAVLPQIGLWDTNLSGTTTNVLSDTPAQYKVEISDTDSAYDANIMMSGSATPNSASTNYKLSGAAAGAWVDINGAMSSEGIPATGVMGGQVYGVFDPTAQTVKAAAAGAWIETSKFLQMVGSNSTTLQDLNIPCFNVGATDLRGDTGNVAGGTINLGSSGDKTRGILNATFFSSSAGGKPSIWASGGIDAGNGVKGSYTGTPATNDYINLTGYHPGTSNVISGLSATFNVQKFDAGTSKWMATVNGTGGFVGSSTFKGAAAGTIGTGAEAGTFGGTAAGIAK